MVKVKDLKKWIDGLDEEYLNYNLHFSEVDKCGIPINEYNMLKDIDIRKRMKLGYCKTYNYFEFHLHPKKKIFSIKVKERVIEKSMFRTYQFYDIYLENTLISTVTDKEDAELIRVKLERILNNYVEEDIFK